MTRSLLVLSGVVGALLLAGCATQSGAPSSNDAYAAKPAAAAPAPAAAPAAAAAPAMSDADLAASLKGEWVGDWQFPGFGGGKFVLRITSVEGTSLKGDAELYGTANGDIKLPLSKATVKDGVLIGEQPNTVYTLRKKDEKSLAGTWAVGAYSGPLTAKR
ncbi:hypothetical protein BH11PSE11_BH11PSE11_17320 [soil metagenome]